MGLSLDPDRFWRVTPKQIALEFKALAIAHTRERNNQAWLAWHIAALSRTNSKKFPKLSSLQVDHLRERQRQSQEELVDSIKLVFLASGGDAADLEKFNGR